MLYKLYKKLALCMVLVGLVFLPDPVAASSYSEDVPTADIRDLKLNEIKTEDIQTIDSFLYNKGFNNSILLHEQLSRTSMNEGEKFREILRVFANAKETCTDGSNNSNTWFVIAISENNIDMVRLFLDSGVGEEIVNDIDLFGRIGTPPIKKAILNKNIPMIRLLVEHGAYIPEELNEDPVVLQARKESEKSNVSCICSIA